MLINKFLKGISKFQHAVGFNYRFMLKPSMGWTTPSRESILWDGLIYLNYNKISGDYAEFGVWKGRTLCTAFHFSKMQANSKNELGKMNFLAFDSFEGFPELKGQDIYPGFEKGGRSCSLEEFKVTTQKLCLPENRLTIYKGWFSDTLKSGNEASKNIPTKSIAFAYVDCDLYESTKDVLLFLKEKLCEGGIVVFDNWFCFGGNPHKGEQQALREFCNKHNTASFTFFKDFGWHGRGFIYNTLTNSQGLYI